MRVTVTPDQIRTAFEAVKDDPSFDQSRGLWERGKPPVEMVQAMALRPEILRAFAGFGGAVYPGGLLERRVQELVIITASQRNACQFCENAHVDMPPRERLAVEYTRAVLADSNNLPDGLMSEVRATFSDPELVELTFLIGYINLLNLFNNSLQVRYRGDYRALLEPVAGA
jgi:alkylhydroperoxidase family enzyme